MLNQTQIRKKKKFYEHFCSHWRHFTSLMTHVTPLCLSDTRSMYHLRTIWKRLTSLSVRMTSESPFIKFLIFGLHKAVSTLIISSMKAFLTIFCTVSGLRVLERSSVYLRDVWCHLMGLFFLILRDLCQLITGYFHDDISDVTHLS